MWQTVAVREVDEEVLLEEQLQAEAAREAMFRGHSSSSANGDKKVSEIAYVLYSATSCDVL